MLTAGMLQIKRIKIGEECGKISAWQGLTHLRKCPFCWTKSKNVDPDQTPQNDLAQML